MVERVKDEEFELLCLRNGIEEKSYSEYVKRAARVQRLTGMKLGYEGLVRYFRLKANLSASTLRGVKSAVLFILLLANKPMPEEEDARLDKILTGFECLKGEPEGMRGAPDEDDVKLLIDEAYREEGPELALAFTVAHGIGLRAGEVEELRYGDIDLRKEIVWTKRKARRYSKVRYGRQIDKPIMTEDALKILTRMTNARGSVRETEKVFPNFKRHQATAVVQRVAKREGWDPDLIWDGIHNMRHGIAASTYREGILATRAVGAWQGRDAVHRYGRQGRIGPADRKRHQAKRARKA